MGSADGQFELPLEIGDGGWTLAFAGVNPQAERVRETLCALGNGRFLTRAAAPEAGAATGLDETHYPGTYAAGIYNRLISFLHGHPHEDESLVNLPNWLPLGWRTDGCGWVVPNGVGFQEYEQRLDLRTGVLHRRYRYTDEAGRSTTVESSALVSMPASHLAALETRFTAENWSGNLQIRSGIDGRVTNSQAPKYAPLASRHLRAAGRGREGPGKLWLRMRTTQSRIEIAVATRTQVSTEAVRQRATLAADYPEETFNIVVRKGEPVRVEKVAAIYTSRDLAISEPVLAAQQAVERAGRFDELCAQQANAWRQLWARCQVELHTQGAERHPTPQLVLNVHIFHLLACASPNTVDIDASVGARGLHGEDYRGHVFWDELFVSRFLALHLPEVSRGLLLYRWRRLDAARRAAAETGRPGAMFGWESGSDGREETPAEVYDPCTGTWRPAHYALQRHVGLAIGYNVWHYYQATADVDFMRRYGAELIVEIARYFADLARKNEATGRYEITGVMGPDEFHTALPGTRTPGLPNNAYTNVMTVWLLRRALEVVDLLSCDGDARHADPLGIRESELARWRDIITCMYVPFHDDGIINQFDGYENLAELDIGKYATRCGGDLSKLDAVLDAEGDSTNNYQLAKQADVLMLLYLFSAEELRELLAALGYEWPAPALPRTVRRYLPRVVHGSSLSRVVYAWVQARSDRTASWQSFMEALTTDAVDPQYGDTRDGVHIGAMAGTLDLAERCYLGVELRDDALWLNPQLPAEITRLHTQLSYRGHQIHVTATENELTLAASACNAAPIKVQLPGRDPMQIHGGQEVTIGRG